MENQRVRLTKTLLRDSLLDLLKEKGITKISVREICEHAQINRTTFYRYYGNQYDLLADIEDQFATNVQEIVESEDTEEENHLVKLLSYMNDNADLCRLLFNGEVHFDSVDRILELPKIRERLNVITDGGEDGGRSYADEFIIGGSERIITSWINKDMREPPEEMAEIIQTYAAQGCGATSCSYGR